MYICTSQSRAAVNAKRWLSSVPWAGKCQDSLLRTGCLRFVASSSRRDMYIKTQDLGVCGSRPQDAIRISSGMSSVAGLVGHVVLSTGL